MMQFHCFILSTKGPRNGTFHYIDILRHFNLAILQIVVPESFNILIPVLREGQLLLTFADVSTDELQALLEVTPAVKLVNDTVVFVRLLLSV